MCAALLGLMLVCSTRRVALMRLGRRLGVGGDTMQRCARGGAVEKRVDVARAGDFESGEAFDGTERSNDFLRDDFGRLAQCARELQGDGRGDFAETQVGRRLQRDVGDVESVFFFQDGAKTIGEPFLAVPEPRESLKNP